MATLLVRNLDPAVHEALRLRSALHGRSVEAEVRAILGESVNRRRRVDWTKVATVATGRRKAFTRAEIDVTYEEP
jgi:plasmid stability protein